MTLTLVLFITPNARSQDTISHVIQKSTLSFEVDPIVPIALHGFSGHLMWKSKKSTHFVFGLAVIVRGKLPPFIINLNSKNRDMGWNYKINQGLGLEAEYYYKEANKGWFSGVQLFTQEINITNDNAPDIKEHRTNTGMAVITSGYKWYPFKKKEHFYIKPWASIGYSGIMKGAFSKEVIPNTKVGSYTYNISRFTPYAAVHLGYTF